MNLFINVLMFWGCFSLLIFLHLNDVWHHISWGDEGFLFQHVLSLSAEAHNGRTWIQFGFNDTNSFSSQLILFLSGTLWRQAILSEMKVVLMRGIRGSDSACWLLRAAGGEDPSPIRLLSASNISARLLDPSSWTFCSTSTRAACFYLLSAPTLKPSLPSSHLPASSLTALFVVYWGEIHNKEDQTGGRSVRRFWL